MYFFSFFFSNSNYWALAGLSGTALVRWENPWAYVELFFFSPKNWLTFKFGESLQHGLEPKISGICD